MKLLLYPALALLAALPLGLLVAGQLGLFQGTMPADLGLRDGLLKAPSATANSVSSQAGRYTGAGADYARIEALRFADTGPEAGARALTRIGAIVLKMPGARIRHSSPDYLYVQFETRWLRFVDDAEFAHLPGESSIQVRSAARLGRLDFGVNRTRIESIRAQFEASAP